MSTAAFSDFKLNKQILNAVAQAGFSQPTAIQQKAIPLILDGHDVMGVAHTFNEGTHSAAFAYLTLARLISFLQNDGKQQQGSKRVSPWEME